MARALPHAAAVAAAVLCCAAPRRAAAPRRGGAAPGVYAAAALLLHGGGASANPFNFNFGGGRGPKARGRPGGGFNFGGGGGPFGGGGGGGGGFNFGGGGGGRPVKEEKKMQDHYKVLGVKRDASDRDIKRAYKKMTKKWHPDRNKHPKAQGWMAKVNEAWGVLKDPIKKEQYDLGNDPDKPNPGGGGGFGGDPFGGGNPFGGGGRGSGPPPKKEKPKEYIPKYKAAPKVPGVPGQVSVLSTKMFSDLCVVEPPHEPGKKRRFRSCLIVFPTAAGVKPHGHDKIASQWQDELWVLAAGQTKQDTLLLDSLADHVGEELRGGDCVLLRRVKDAKKQGKYSLLRPRRRQEIKLPKALQGRVESLLTGGSVDETEWRKAARAGSWSGAPK